MFVPNVRLAYFKAFWTFCTSLMFASFHPQQESPTALNGLHLNISDLRTRPVRSWKFWVLRHFSTAVEAVWCVTACRCSGEWIILIHESVQFVFSLNSTCIEFWELMRLKKKLVCFFYLFTDWIKTVFVYFVLCVYTTSLGGFVRSPLSCESKQAEPSKLVMHTFCARNSLCLSQ